MAKGNLLLGTAKNSVGDVVMYRREGAQITRVRVRNVKNPKTDAQSYQRAIMAPIAKFYSPLSVVLERSFEGLSKAKSHNKFNQVNANLARKNKWALHKGTGFFPLPYQLSQGTLQAVTYEDDGQLDITIPSLKNADTLMSALSAALVSMGYKVGDVVTILLVSGIADGDKYSDFVPKAVQFEVNTTATETIADFFGSSVAISIEDNKLSVLTVNGNAVFAGAVIVSRFDGNMWRRSTQSLVVDSNIINTVTDNAAVAAAIASYGKTAGDGNPIVYLDGDELADGE